MFPGNTFCIIFTLFPSLLSLHLLLKGCRTLVDGHVCLRMGNWERESRRRITVETFSDVGSPTWMQCITPLFLCVLLVDLAFVSMNGRERYKLTLLCLSCAKPPYTMQSSYYSLDVFEAAVKLIISWLSVHSKSCLVCTYRK